MWTGDPAHGRGDARRLPLLVRPLPLHPGARLHRRSGAGRAGRPSGSLSHFPPPAPQARLCGTTRLPKAGTGRACSRPTRPCEAPSLSPLVNRSCRGRALFTAAAGVIRLRGHLFERVGEHAPGGAARVGHPLRRAVLLHHRGGAGGVARPLWRSPFRRRGERRPRADAWPAASPHTASVSRRSRTTCSTCCSTRGARTRCRAPGASSSS